MLICLFAYLLSSFPLSAWWAVADFCLASGELLVGESPDGVEFFDDGKFHEVLSRHVWETGAVETDEVVLFQWYLRIGQAHEFGLLDGLPFSAGLTDGHGCDGEGGFSLIGIIGGGWLVRCV